MKKQRCTRCGHVGHNRRSCGQKRPQTPQKAQKTVPTQPHPPTQTRPPSPTTGAAEGTFTGTAENFPSTTVNNVPLTRENIAVWWHLVKPVTLSEPQTYSEYSDYAEALAHFLNDNITDDTVAKNFLHTEPQIVREAAAELELPPKMLSFLAEDPHPIVRMLTAANSGTPIPVLKKLAHDDSAAVRHTAADNLAEKETT